jgi:hypothetical protein
LRRARLDDVGEYCLILVKTLAHIRAGCEWSDFHGTFIGQFYAYIRTLCTELFLGRRTHKLANAHHAAEANSRYLSAGADTVYSVKEFREMFGLLSRAEEARADVKQANADGPAPPLALTYHEQLSMRSEAVSQFMELKLTATSTATDRDPTVANEALLARLEQYRPFAVSSAVRNHLVSLEKTIAAREKSEITVLNQVTTREIKCALFLLLSC